VATEAPIKRRELETESVEPKAATPEQSTTPPQGDRKLPENDLFSDRDKVTSERGQRGDSKSSSLDGGDQPAREPSVSPNPRPFGRRNRR